MEKETLKEFIKEELDGYDEIDFSTYERFIELGAKWQQERSYSEEDLRESFKQSRQALIFEKDIPPVYETFDEWFEKFKNK